MRSVAPQTLVDSPWHLALCRPNQAHIAFRNLAAAGVDVFMPRTMVSRRWRGRRIDEWRPVFGGYLFFSTDPATPRWARIAATPGVGRIIGAGARGPACVPSAVVTGLMLRCDADGCLIPPGDFTVGETVRVTSGPFADFVCTVESVDADRRIHLLLDLLGRRTAITLDADTLERRL